jgi:hypothetical protein
MEANKKIIDLWSAHVTSAKLRRGPRYFYEGLVESFAVAAVVPPCEVSWLNPGSIDTDLRIGRWDGILLRPILRLDRNAASLDDLAARPKVSLIGRASVPSGSWWVDHPLAIYLTVDDIPWNEPVLRPPTDGDWWGDPAVMRPPDHDRSTSERQARFAPDLVVLDDQPMRRCHLPGAVIQVAESGIIARTWIHPFPRPWAPFCAYFPNSKEDRVVSVGDTAYAMTKGFETDPCPEAAADLADRCTLAAALETLDTNLRWLSDRDADTFRSERVAMLRDLWDTCGDVGRHIHTICALMTNADNLRMRNYGGVLDQFPNNRVIDDEDLALMSSFGS